MADESKDKITSIDALPKDSASISNTNQNKVTFDELYTLKDVYEIEFGVRGYWNCKFDNAPLRYRQKGIIAKACTDTDYSNGFSPRRIGLYEVYTPDVLIMPSLNITFYDDTDSTVENWLRAWKRKMNDNKGRFYYIEDYADRVYISQYNQHHVLQNTRKFLVAPVGKIQIVNETADVITLNTEFRVFDFEIL